MLMNKNGNAVPYQGTFGGVRMDNEGKFYAGFGTEDIREVPCFALHEEEYILPKHCMTRFQFNKLKKVN